MKPIYKIIKVRKPFCPKCKGQLCDDWVNQGNCKCGTWVLDSMEKGLCDYKITNYKGEITN